MHAQERLLLHRHSSTGMLYQSIKKYQIGCIALSACNEQWSSQQCGYWKQGMQIGGVSYIKMSHIPLHVLS